RSSTLYPYTTLFRSEDPRGEDHLVAQRVVVGVDGVGRHEPVVRIGRPPDAGEVAAALEGGGRHAVGELVVVDEVQTLVATPDLGDRKSTRLNSSHVK